MSPIDNMSPGWCLRTCMCLLLTLTLIDASAVEISREPAHFINSYKQLVASSTLQWTPVSSLLSGVVSSSSVVKVENSAVCRVKDGGDILPGRTDMQGKCVVGAGGKITLRSRYDLLVDLWGMSRVEWRHWDMFSFVSPGTVAFTDQVFVARALRTDQPFILGDLNTLEDLNGRIRTHLPDNHTGLHTNYGYHAAFTTTGDVLVEVEPLKYKLTQIQLVTRREKKTKSKAFQVGSVTVTRDDNDDNGSEECVTLPLRYNYTKSFNWGRIEGTIRGLPAVAILNQDHTQLFKFGMESSKLEEGEWSVRAALLPGTAVNVTVTARLVRTEVPYTAVLESMYGTGVPSRKHISGVYSHTRLEQFQEEHGEAFDEVTREEAESPCEGRRRTDCCEAYTPPAQQREREIMSTTISTTSSTTTMTTSTTSPETTMQTMKAHHPLSTLFPTISPTVSPIDKKREKWMKMFFPEPLAEEDGSKNKTVRAAPLSLQNSSERRLQSVFLTVICVFLTTR